MKLRNMMMGALLAVMALFSPDAMNAASSKGDFTVGKGTFLLNGKPFVVKAAEVHYPRIPRAYWDHRIKMCKALGMNTLCLYVFWNIHEQQEGQFDFTGNNDVAAFCRLAQKNGMYVIVRPGPYVCAEWEMGGLPWWLLKKKDIRLRERDPYFMERVEIFEQKVAEQLAPLTIQRGGPIIMVQVENEYGSYGEDKAYVSQIRDVLKKYWSLPLPPSNGRGNVNTAQPAPSPTGEGRGGASPLLFQCDWASNFTRNGLDDLLWTMNFGTGANIDDQFRKLGELRPDAPKMCSEFWSGWFDKWGARHETRPAKDMVAGIDEMLSKGISFSLYMTHGGTSFGHWAGANSPGFAPDVTSYDYDAPINEYGQPTEKYWELRKTLEKYNDGKKLPGVPKAPMPVITIPKFKLEYGGSLEHLISKKVKSHNVQTFEEMDMGWGTAIYTTANPLPEISTPSMLTINDPHDFVQVFINSKYIGKIDRVKNEKTLMLPPIRRGSALTLVVEAIGRINFGRAIKDFKGITNDVTLSAEIGGNEVTWNLKEWETGLIPDDYAHLSHIVQYVHNDLHTPYTLDDVQSGLYHGTFDLKKVGDTFLNTEAFGKGQVWINGHALGRFWYIGPQQTLYVPGCWLKKGRNEVMVYDVIGPRSETTMFGQDHPELDKLNIEKSNKHNNIGDRPDLNSMQPAFEGEIKSGNGWQTVKLNKPQQGRYLALQILSNQDGSNVSAIAELYLQGSDGKRLSREPWTTKYADSENENGNHTGDKVFDLQESTYWQTIRSTPLPHLLVIDLGSRQTVTAFEYLPRAEQGAPQSIKEVKVYVY
jgi:beta-galactosidase